MNWIEEITRPYPLLLVEDNAHDKELFAAGCRGFNLELLHVQTAEEALVIMHVRQDVKLVIIDENLPGMTGTQLAKQIRVIAPKTRIVLISGVNEMPPDASVADVFLSKVEGPDALCSTVASALSKL